MYDDSSTHSGNYYVPGTQRVLAKLADLGVAVPAKALAYPEWGRQMLAEFTYLEHAMLDWFCGRDYEQAQSLIHFSAPRDEWHVIYVLDDDKCPFELSHQMVAPSLLDALGAVVDSCRRDKVTLGHCRKEGPNVVAVIDGIDVLRIEPIQLEPFNLSVRNRVQAAFKGVRRGDLPATARAAACLPGYRDTLVRFDLSPPLLPDSDLLFGFTGNWVVAMRNALKQVGIEVKQSQAQELVAVFFGAGSWHQLIKHRDTLNGSQAPVMVSVETSDTVQCKYYRTTEEAIFATGFVLKNYPEPVVIRNFDASLDRHRVLLEASRLRDMPAEHSAIYRNIPYCIVCGYNDYWSLEYDSVAPSIEGEARQLLKTLG